MKLKNGLSFVSVYFLFIRSNPYMQCAIMVMTMSIIMVISNNKSTIKTVQKHRKHKDQHPETTSPPRKYEVTR